MSNIKAIREAVPTKVPICPCGREVDWWEEIDSVRDPDKPAIWECPSCYRWVEIHAIVEVTFVAVYG